MAEEKLTEKLQFVPKIWSVLVYLLLLIIVFLLFMGRKSEMLQIGFLLDWDEGFYTHISNFVISFYLVLVTGFVEILISGKLKGTYLIIILLIAANFIYEWFIPVLNTPDKTDALYGFAGSLAPLVYLFLFQKFGIKKNPLHKNP